MLLYINKNDKNKHMSKLNATHSSTRTSAQRNERDHLTVTSADHFIRHRRHPATASTCLRSWWHQANVIVVKYNNVLIHFLSTETKQKEVNTAFCTQQGIKFLATTSELHYIIISASNVLFTTFLILKS